MFKIVFLFVVLFTVNVSCKHKIYSGYKFATHPKQKYRGIEDNLWVVKNDTDKLVYLQLKSNKTIWKELQDFLKKEKELKLAEIKYFKKQEGLIVGIQIQKSQKFNFSRSDITFILFSRQIKNGVNLAEYTLSKYDITKPTKLITHGFISSGTSNQCITIKNNYLNKTDCNIIIVDWGEIAGNIIYPITIRGTGTVADYCAKFLQYLFSYVGLKPNETHLIGHSLGAHVMGFTGRRLINKGYKVGRITGLDPAGPFFSDVYINKNDGEFVDIIHTDAGWLGLDKSIGHIDFYPNGGESPQPGCLLDDLIVVDTCSHSMSWKFYSQTILEENLYISYCTTNETVPMGSATPPTSRGECVLKTN